MVAQPVSVTSDSLNSHGVELMPAANRLRLPASFLALLLFLSGVAGAEARDLSVFETARKSVVSVLPVWSGRPANADEPEGSGVVIADGQTIVTANHVLGPPGREVPVLVRDADGTSYRAQVTARHRASDLAILRIDTKLPVLANRAGDLRLGEEICAIGNAFGMGLSVSCGRVSAVHRAGVGFNAIEDFIQTDAAVNPGMSGGALVDMDGNLAGILSAIFTKQSDANIGMNFAVDVRLASVVADAMTKTGRFLPARTGLLLRPVPRKGETGRQGAQVVKAIDGLPGARSGLTPGDIVYQAGERRIRKPQDWLSVVAGLRPGDQIRLSGVRGGTERRWTLQLGE